MGLLVEHLREHGRFQQDPFDGFYSAPEALDGQTGVVEELHAGYTLPWRSRVRVQVFAAYGRGDGNDTFKFALGVTR